MKILILNFLIIFNTIATNHIGIRPQIANRFLVENILVDIFGIEVKKYTHKFILPNISTFGGPCDIYEQIRKDKEDVLNIYSSCFGNKGHHKEELNGNSSSMRSGLILKTCKSIINDQEIINSFYKKISASSIFTEKVLRNIHNQFFPNKEITKKQIEVLRRLFYKSTHNKWDQVVLTYCISPDWQLL